MTEAPTLENFRRDWIDEFNRHDPEAIVSQHSDDASLTSPPCLAITGGATATAEGIPGLRGHFAAALDRGPDLSFSLIEQAAGVNGPCQFYHGKVHGRLARKAFEPGSDGKATTVYCHHV